MQRPKTPSAKTLAASREHWSEEQQTAKHTPLSLRHNFSWTFVGDATFNACQWAILTVIAKLVSPEKVGEYSLALAITAPVILFANLNLRQFQATDARRTVAFGDYFGLRLLTIAFSLCVVAGVIAVIHPGLEMAAVIALVTLSKAFDSVSDTMYGLMQQNERMDYISISRIMQGILQLVIMSVVFYVTRSLIWATAMVALSSGLVTAFYDIPTAARVGNNLRSAQGAAASKPDSLKPGSFLAVLKPSWAAPSLWTLTRLSLPLGFVALLNMLNINIPRYFIQHDFGPSQVAFFSAMWNVTHPIAMASGASLSAGTPRLARYYVESLAEYNRLLLLLLGLALFSGIFGVLLAHFFGRQVLTILYRPIYASHPIAFQWIMAAAGASFVSSVFSQAASAARRFVPQPFIYLAAASSSALACVLLVPRFGLLGAAWSYGIGCTVSMLGFAWLAAGAIDAAARRNTREAKIIRE